MAKNPSHTLPFSISTHDLRVATTRLGEKGGPTLYQPTWRVLTRELGKRRELKVPVDGISARAGKLRASPRACEGTV
jgi:hypothetical protein